MRKLRSTESLILLVSLVSNAAKEINLGGPKQYGKGAVRYKLVF